jgi:flagellar hook-associated protein 3 FlgL
MRVTEGTIANTTLTGLQRIQGRLQHLQEQVSSQTRVTNPGDDPLTAQQILDLNGELNDSDQYTRNITTGNSYLSIMDGTLSTMGDSIIRAKEIALETANGTLTASERQAAMQEVLQIKSQLITLGNTQTNGKFVFAGYKNDVAPFDATGAYTNPGDDALISINIDKSNQVAVNYPGEKLLNGSGGGTDVMGTLDSLINALNTNNQAGVQNTLDDLDKSAEQILTARTEIGARMSRFDAVNNFLENTKVYLQKAMSGKQDIDFTKAISDLTQQQTAYQAALASTAKISQMSLLDYLK